MKNRLMPSFLTYRINENDIMDNICKEEFFEWLNAEGCTIKELKSIFESKRISSNEQMRFNLIIRKANREIHIDIIDIILYFEENFSRFKKIIAILDEETMKMLKDELAKKYNIKLSKSILYKLFS